MKSDGSAAFDVVIIGGGYSGTMLAAQLARRGLRAALIEGGGRAGRGTAYSTPEDVHLLNVSAQWMSAWSDQPEHFAAAVEGEGYRPTDFVPRRRFGDYLRNILDRTGVDIVGQRAVAANHTDAGWLVSLADGSGVAGRALVLALGNQPPDPLRVAQKISPELFVNDPWSDEGRAAVARAAEQRSDVLIVGTGLTMVDVVLSLDAADHRGRILALSRRGLAPRAHARDDATPAEESDVPRKSVAELGRWLRRRGNEIGWRAAVDSLRCSSQALWQGWSEIEQERFLRHARPWWDVHRHRIAPEVAAVLERLQTDGRLEIVGGRIRAMHESWGELTVEFRRRGRDYLEQTKVALGVNCTGPLGAMARTNDAVLQGLFAAGLARPDRLGMGIDVDPRSRVSGAPRAWAVGPLTKGRFWEIVAVPDIRHQVAEVAKDIAEELEHAVQS